MPEWVGTAVTAVAFVSLVWLELRRPLRKRKLESKLIRNTRNLAIAGIGAGALALAERPAVLPLARWAERRQFGILGFLGAPEWISTIAAFLLMDYTLYLWHVMTHRVPFLWQFHAPHHADLDMDASTALRFHLGELLLSVPFRCAQVVVVGTSPFAYTLWQACLMVFILFHHSNADLPPWLDRRLEMLLVTPRMHGIHHSTIRAESDSNWSSGLSFWDRIHGTHTTGVPQEAITIGLPAYRTISDVTIGQVMAMPLENQQRAWLPPNDKAVLNTADYKN